MFLHLKNNELHAAFSLTLIRQMMTHLDTKFSLVLLFQFVWICMNNLLALHAIAHNFSVPA